MVLNHRPKIKLGLFLAGTGHHIASWRMPNAFPNGPLNFDYLKSICQLAEKGKLDFVFFADGLFIDKNSHPNIIAKFEPITLLSALSSVTKNIGLVGTASTTYNEPFNIARYFASLDYLSNGRSAWNVVTTVDPSSSYNFNNSEHMEHSERYIRAEEFVNVVKGLWDTWQDSALIRNKETGSYLKDELLHELNHKGDYFSVKGPLNVPRPPQSHPVLIQAGSSKLGQQFASKFADVVFTSQNYNNGRVYYKNLKELTKKNKRSFNDIIIMPGISFLLGSTENEAKERFELLNNLILPSVGINILSKYLGGIDLKPYSIEGPFHQIVEPSKKEFKIRYEFLRKVSDERKYNLLEVSRFVAGTNGHNIIVGTPEKVAKVMEKWYLNFAADAFNLMPLTLPDDLEIFVDHVIPILREKNIFREEYEGSTLRENLGLRRKKNRFEI